MKAFVLFSGLMLFAFGSFGQTISGTVKNNDGEPLAGAHVRLLGTYMAAVTNYDGKYAIRNVPEGRYEMQVSFVGYEWATTVLNMAGKNAVMNFDLESMAYVKQALNVEAIRARHNTPTTYTNISKEEINKMNLGQDMPYVMEMSPSVVVTSDAGAGVGYTGMRIRGIDPTRVNITINGIPLNDAESQGVFWVDLPDFATSTENIQIQRGVGTSTNGAGAFGATVNLSTTTVSDEAFVELSNAQGSFGTFKNNISFGTGMLKDQFTFNGRLSRIVSDGFIDRSSANLRSFYLSAGHHTEKSSTTLNVFTGHEVTQQAWYGTPSAKLNNDDAGIEDYILFNGLSPAQAANLRSSDRRYNHYLYDREVDDYTQSHYQLINELTISKNFSFQSALHLTRGYGYFEQFQDKTAPFDDTQLSFYGLDDVIIGSDTITSSNVIRRRWLDNDFYGLTYAAKYTGVKKLELILGGAWNRYLGAHFGEVVWSEFASNGNIRDRYYDNDAEKKDFNTYLKGNYQATDQLGLFADVQFRNVGYSFLGLDNTGVPIDQNVSYNFVNPKVGATYAFDSQNQVYASVAMGSKEPNRNDFVESTPTSRPSPERLVDYELGYRTNSRKSQLQASAYFMDYTDQLVLTGQLNDVGASTRVNIPESYRAGIELEWGLDIFKRLNWTANATLSSNKIRNFTAYVDNWDTGVQDVETYASTDIAFSPSLIGASNITWTLYDADAEKKENDIQVDLSLLSKYVGRQYVDNTQSEDRSIDPYFLNDIRLNINEKNGKLFKNVDIFLLVKNIFNVEYESNAWVYRYILGGENKKLDGYFPQAGTYYLAGLTLRL